MNSSPRTARSVAAARTTDGKSLVGLFAVAVFAWSVDFKVPGSASSTGGAAAIQAALLSVYLGMFFWIISTAVKAGTGVGSMWVLISAVAIFMVDSATIGLINNQEFHAIAVNLIPPFIYASASVLTYVTLSVAKDRQQAVLTVLRVACLLYIAARLGITFVTKGIDVGHSRYEVLSGAATPALGIVALALVVRVSTLDVLIMLFNLAVTLLSVTRTLFVVLAAQLASVFMARPTALFKGTTVKGILLIACAGAVIAAADIGAGTGLLERWVGRLTVSGTLGADPTALSRSAETHFMMESFTASTDTLLFGNGLAAVSSLTGPDAARAAQLVGWAAVSDVHSVGYGHQNYASILFVAGLLGGGGLVLIQIINVMQAIALIRRVQLVGVAQRDGVAHLAAWGALMVQGVATYGLFGAVIGDRPMCVWYGIGTGTLYWARETLKLPEKPQPARPRYRPPAGPPAKTENK